MENEEAILALYKELGAVEKTIRDRPQQDGKRRLLRNEAETLLKSVRPDMELDNADDLRPLLNNKKWISGLAQRHVQLTSQKDTAVATLRDIEDDQESTRNELGKQPQSDLDLSELKATIVTARKAGDIEQRLADLQKRASSEKSLCENEFARLGMFTGTVESLLKIAMPVSETLDTFEKESDELSEKIRDCGRRQQETKEEKKQTEQELKALLLTSDVPTISELEESRNVRNTGWSLIKRKYIEKVDVDKDICEFASESDLSTVYEQKVDNADHVSDRLRLAADQVVKRADLEAKLENLRSRLDDIADEIKKANHPEIRFFVVKQRLTGLEEYALFVTILRCQFRWKKIKVCLAHSFCGIAQAKFLGLSPADSDKAAIGIFEVHLVRNIIHESMEEALFPG